MFGSFGTSSVLLGVLAYNNYYRLENEENVLCDRDSDAFSMYAKCEMKILVGSVAFYRRHLSLSLSVSPSPDPKTKKNNQHTNREETPTRN